MTWPQHQDPSGNRRAKAPYNFVPLPEKVKRAADLPALDAHHPERHSGWLDCALTTSSPLYIRTGLTPEQARQGMEAKDLPDFFYTDPHTKAPVIPGSSLRGMLRTLVEIVSYSKVQPVTDKHKLSFRAVAAPGDDPLSPPYQEALGKYGRNIKAGYLVRHGERWYIKPARRPQSMRLPEQGAYLKVKDKQIPGGAIPHLIRFRESKYRPQYHDVSFEVEPRQGKRGKYVAITEIGPRDAGYRYRGVLVCSGNMAETGGSQSKRKNYALVLEREPRGKEVPIGEQTIQDYVDSLTEFQKQSPPFDERKGCLIKGRPIFYVEERGAVVALGHTPNFRIPAWLHGSQPRRAATPYDLVPEALRDPTQTDLAEAIFGYVETAKQDARPAARAGRVFVGDAALLPGQSDIWLTESPLTPKILASPKPTTFQHYLAQTEPDDKRDLRHYGRPTPGETVIRGHKLYWHKDDVTVDDIKEDKEIKKDDKQHTAIKALCSGVRFRARIYFEGLDAVELGALLWLLDVAADKDHRLKIGMGKPLGLGAVQVEAELHLTNRRERYTALFQDDAWASGEGEGAAVHQKSSQAFERWVLDDRGLNPGRAARLRDVPRIQTLLFLLSWPGPDKDETRYLEIEHPQYDNEYKNRPVLPTPQGVVGGATGTSPAPRPQRPARRQAAKPPKEPAEDESPAQPQSGAEVKPGMLLEGRIKRVEISRVVVDIGVGEATLPLDQLGFSIKDLWEDEIEERLPAGKRLLVRVKSINRKGRIQLSLEKWL